MDEAQIKFGDKIFLYGKMTEYESIEELGLIEPEYNSVMGYTPVGGYYVIPQKTDQVDACLPGFVASLSLARETLFSHKNFVDVTDLLSRQEPILSGTTVWMPIP